MFFTENLAICDIFRVKSQKTALPAVRFNLISGKFRNHFKMVYKKSAYNSSKL